MINFESCFRELYPALCVFAFQYLKDSKQSEDVVQEAFLKLWDRYSSFDEYYKVKAFLYLTVRNNAINILNHAVVENKYCTGKSIDSTASDPAFELAMISNETNRLLHQAIDRLPPQTKRVIVLSMEDKTNREIAADLGISIDTVKTLKKRAYKALKEQLADHYT